MPRSDFTQINSNEKNSLDPPEKKLKRSFENRKPLTSQKSRTNQYDRTVLLVGSINLQCMFKMD